MENELYKNLGTAKCKEISTKYEALWSVYNATKATTKSKEIGGVLVEGIAKDFIRELLPTGFKIKSGLIFDTETKKLSPQKIDAIIYHGVPILEFTDIVIAEKKQVQAMVEIKSYIDTTELFGDKNKATGARDPHTQLFKSFQDRKPFIQANAKYILFALALHSAEEDNKVVSRLNQICDIYAIVRRKTKIDWDYNFDASISELIKYLRNLS